MNGIDFSQLDLNTLLNLAATFGITFPGGATTKIEVLAQLNNYLKPTGLMLVPKWTPYAAGAAIVGAYLIGNARKSKRK